MKRPKFHQFDVVETFEPGQLVVICDRRTFPNSGDVFEVGTPCIFLQLSERRSNIAQVLLPDARTWGLPVITICTPHEFEQREVRKQAWLEEQRMTHEANLIKYEMYKNRKKSTQLMKISF